MSLLGVVAGFMTHEFDVELAKLENSKRSLNTLANKRPEFWEVADQLATHIKSSKEFVEYSSGYIHDARTVPKKPYPVRPRIRQVKRVFGGYATKHDIDVDLAEVVRGLIASLVHVVLHSGLALNLFTNALNPYDRPP